MSSQKPAIEVHNLSKRYKISHLDKPKYHQASLRDDLVGLAKKPLQLIGSQHGSHKEEFWALKDMSFTIEPGEAVGIIGKNGSGKSTLFKILSRITQPTQGRAVIRGKVSSLLEVGSGFHIELTGRENVYFNGAILGMRKSEIDRKFNDIVEFAEIDKFIDTPVKFYSSGMKSRLGFAVAAHLDPDVLLVDEVLAVGDAEFKIKCIEKMREIANQGRTVLFVTHIMAQAKKVCDTGILIKNGQIAMRGDISDIADEYLAANLAGADAADEDADLFGGADDKSSLPLHKRTDFEGNGDIKFFGLTSKVNIVSGRPKAEIEIKLANQTNRAMDDVQIAVGLRNELKHPVTSFSTAMSNKKLSLGPKKETTLKISVDSLSLTPGQYTTRLTASSNSRPRVVYNSMSNTGKLDVPEYEFYKTPLLDITSRTGPYLADVSFDID